MDERSGRGKKGRKRRPPDYGERTTAALRTYSPDEMREVLTRREIKALLLRSGAYGMAEPMTYAEVGRRLGVGRERARQVIASAIGKLARQREARETKAAKADQQGTQADTWAADDNGKSTEAIRRGREIQEELRKQNAQEVLRRAGFLPPLPGRERPDSGADPLIGRRRPDVGD